MTTQWTNINDKTSIILTKKNGTKLTLNVGDCIKFTGLCGRPDGIIIIEFTTKNFKSEPSIGPIGMTYLPWRKDENKWATTAFSMRGNPRHIICYPTGFPHFGQHIEWDTVEIIENPEK